MAKKFPGANNWMKADQFDYEWPQVRVDKEGGDPRFYIHEVVGFNCEEPEETWYFEEVVEVGFKDLKNLTVAEINSYLASFGFVKLPDEKLKDFKEDL